MSGIAVSSRIRLARNLEGKPFTFNATPKQQKELIASVAEIFKAQKEYNYLEMAALSDVDKRLLVERHLISPELATSQSDCGVWLTKDESISIMVNEEDHIRLQALKSGFCLTEALEKANEVDKQIYNPLKIAFSQKLGYLTCCPTNLGTGMRASVMLHLPALAKSGRIAQLLDSITKLGLTVRGIYGEGSQVQGDMYQVSNRITLGITQKDIVTSVSNVCKAITEKEEKAREFLKKNGALQLEDLIYRAYGTLCNAKILNTNEFMQLISDLKMGAGMGYLILKQPDIIDKLIIAAQPAAIMKRSGQDLNELARDEARALIVNKEVTKNIKISK